MESTVTEKAKSKNLRACKPKDAVVQPSGSKDEHGSEGALKEAS